MSILVSQRINCIRKRVKIMGMLDFFAILVTVCLEYVSNVYLSDDGSVFAFLFEPRIDDDSSALHYWVNGEAYPEKRFDFSPDFSMRVELVSESDMHFIDINHNLSSAIF